MYLILHRWHLPMKLQIRQKILLYLLTFLGIYTGVLTYFTYKITDQHLQTTMGGSLQALVGNHGRFIDNFLEHQLIDIRLISQADVLEDSDPAKIHQYFDEIHQISKQVDRLLALDLKGKVISSIPDNLPLEHWKQNAEFDFLFQESGSARQNEVFFSNPYWDSLSQTVQLDLFTPITDDANETKVGVLVCTITTTIIKEYLMELEQAMEGDNTNYLMGPKNIEIHLQDSQLVMGLIQPGSRLDQIQRHLAKNTANKDTVLLWGSEEGALVGYFRLGRESFNETGGWTMISIKPQSQVLQFARRLRNNILLQSLILMTLLGLITLIFTRRMTRPLLQFKEGLIRVREGDYQIHLPEKGEGELGEIAKTFNQLIAHLKRSEIELTQKDERFHKIIELSTDSHSIIKDGKIIYANQATADMFGYSSVSKIIGQSPDFFLREDYRKTGVERFQQLFSENATLSYQPIVAIKQDKSEIHLLGSATLIMEEDTPSIHVTLRNITETLMMQRELVQREERFRQVIELSIDAHFAIVDEKISYANPAAADILGFDHPGELLGRSPEEFLHEEYVQEGGRRWMEQIAAFKGALAYQQIRGKKQDGTELRLLTSATLIKENAQQYLHVILRDITHAYKMQQEMSLSEERFRMAALSSRDIIYDWDIATNHIWFSDGITTLFGFQPEFFNNYDSWFEKIHPEDQGLIDSSIQQAIAEKKDTWKAHYRFSDAGSEWKQIEDKGFLLYDAQNMPTRMVGSMVDVTEKHNARKELVDFLIMGQEQERKRLAAELHDSLGQTLSLVSLNLDSLLSSFSPTGSSQGKKLVQTVDMVNHAIEEIRTISQNLSPRALEEFGLVEVLENMFARVQSSTSIQTQLDLSPAFPQLDPEQEINLYRIIQEALNNSIKHGAPSQISLSLQIKGPLLQFQYQDNGKGFESANRDNFQHINGIRNIQNRILVLGGRMNLSSSPGKGMNLSFQIPH